MIADFVKVCAISDIIGYYKDTIILSYYRNENFRRLEVNDILVSALLTVARISLYEVSVQE